VLGRALGELGQPVVFENLAGAGGNVGTATAAKAEPDGTTLLYGTNGTLAINTTLYKRPGFDVAKDFLPVSRLTEIGMVCVVRPGLEVANVRDLLAQLKARPGKFTYGSAGNGTSSHLAMELLKAQQKLAVVHIPYRGGAAAMTDLIGGQVDLMIEVMPNATSQVTAGRVRALAVTTARRAPALPDVPTMAEAGVSGMDVTAWDALMVPAGTPPAIVAQLHKAVQAALSSPDLTRQLNARGAVPSPSSPQELAAFIRSETTRWGAAVARSGATVD
jgi:tripartite-type tricarboxylate transporter receptor subunit TctC